MMMTACSSGGAVVPTQVLIPPTPTVIPPSPTPTSTRTAPLLPSDLATSIPETLATLEIDDERRIAGLALAELPAGATLRLMQAVDWRLEEGDCPGYTPFIVPGYRLIFLSDALVYEYHAAVDGEIRRCQVIDVLQAQGETLLLVDPVAAELATLARQRLAQQFELPTRRVILVEAAFITWADSSLGCPQADQTYTPVAIDGYRIVFSVADEAYNFHTDFDRYIECPSENIVLPESE